MIDHGSIFASKELLDIISRPEDKENSLNTLHSTNLKIGNKNYECNILGITISDFIIELTISLNPVESIEILRSSLNKRISMPNLLPDIGKCIISQIEFKSNYEIKLTAARANS